MSLETAGALVALVLGVLALFGFFYTYVLLPQLDDRFARLDNTEAIENIEKQVTQNGGQNDPPTIPDKFHDLEVITKHTNAMTAAISDNVHALADVLEGHTKWSEEWTARVERELAALSTRVTLLERQAPPGT